MRASSAFPAIFLLFVSARLSKLLRSAYVLVKKLIDVLKSLSELVNETPFMNVK